MKPTQATALVCTAAIFAAAPAFSQVIDLGPSQTIGPSVIPSGTTVNVNGGTIGLGVDLSNGTLNVNSGSVAVGATSIATGFTNSNNTVNINGGTVGGFFQNTNGTTLNINDGVLDSFGVFSGSTANINGGVVGRFPDIFSTGTVNISGGDVFAVRVFDGGTVNFFGTEFALNGDTIDDLTLGETRTITQRNVTLSGRLADGSAIETDLNTTFGGFFSSNPDGAGANATVTVTLVPEPSSLLLLGTAGVALLGRRRRA